MVKKGPVAVDGISLTVNAIRGGRFFINVMPFTARETTLGSRKVGEMVNIETDVIGRYVESFIRSGRQIGRGFLSDEGFIETRRGHQCGSPRARFRPGLTRR